MKIILTYEKRKQYQAKFIYENKEEIKIAKNIIDQFFINESRKNHIDIIKQINIPNEIIKEFLKVLLEIKNITIIAGDNEFNINNTKNIEDIINSLHIRITLRKGKYFNFQDVYYVTFKYANDSQREEVAYDINTNLNSILGKEENINNSNYLFPFIVNRKGEITFQNTGIIGGTNIPENTLTFFLLRFINEYHAILIVDSDKKTINNNHELAKYLNLVTQPKIKTRKRKKDA